MSGVGPFTEQDVRRAANAFAMRAQEEPCPAHTDDAAVVLAAAVASVEASGDRLVRVSGRAGLVDLPQLLDAARDLERDVDTADARYVSSGVELLMGEYVGLKRRILSVLGLGDPASQEEK